MKDASRLSLIALFLFFLFALLIVQFYRIQILEGEKWTAQARSQHETVVNEPFKRGVFYSNTSIKKGHVEKPRAFVLDILKYHLNIDPEMIPRERKEEIAREICSFLAAENLEPKKIYEQFYKKSRYRRLYTWISPDIKEKIETWWRSYAKRYKIPRNALYFVKDYKRSYPFDAMLGQVLHTVRDDKEAKTQQGCPTGGLEVYFHEYLKGETGKRKILRSPRNPMESGKVLVPPKDGADIHLTINHYLQAIAEEEIEKGVKRVEAKAGWAVLMDPFSGEILAMAQYPFFHPGEYRKYFNDPVLVEHTKLKPVTSCYEMGSIIKPITTAVALLANEELQKQGEPPLFDPHEKVSLLNPYFPGRKKPVKDVGYHKYVNMYMAIQKSSNIYMAYLIDKILSRMGEQWYRDKMHDIFGFGKKTGIEYPYENPGFFPTPGAFYANGSPQWSGPTPYSLVMGYNFLANSIQMLKAFAIIANGGFDIQPTLLRKMEKEGTVLLDNTIKAPRRRILPETVCEEITKALQYGTKPGGSSSRADVYGYTEAAKTGTAEKIKDGKYDAKHHLSSVIGFAPAKNPKFVLLIAIDEPKYRNEPGIGKMHYGGICAAPVFREIATRTLQYLGVTPDDPYGYPPNDPRHDPEKAVWAKETRELLELYRSWNH